MKIIPAIDLKDGKCVRLFKGDFDRVTEYSSDPTVIGRRFSQLKVADLHIVDLDGARSGTQDNAQIVAEIASQTDLSIQLGGGIRERADIERWLSHGVRRCVIGSVAISEPDIVIGWLNEFGADRIILALDVKIDDQGTPQLTTHGWTRNSGVSLWDCLGAFAAAGAQHVLCTDVARDGAMSGPNVELYEETLRRFPRLLLQASGGVRNLADLEQLRDSGLPAAITGRALLDGEISEDEVATFRQNA